MAKDPIDSKDTKPKRARPGGRYKYCVVPHCRSSTARTPAKLFFSMPTGEARARWCAAMGRGQPYKPLSPMCNRFCCEDHFDLEEDMENYIHWKLMGIEVTKKLIIKKGVVPHRFECRGKPDTTTTEPKEKKSRQQLIEEILEEHQEKEMETTLYQRLQNEKKKRKKNKKQKPQYIQKLKKISEAEMIAEQREKLKRISHVAHETQEIPQEDTEKYIFQIKVEAEDDTEQKGGDMLLQDYIVQDSDVGHDSSQLLDVQVKVEPLDEDSLLVVKEELNIEDETCYECN